MTAEVPDCARQHERWAPFWLAWYRLGPPRWIPGCACSRLGRWIVIGLPMLWLLLFFLAPFLIDLKIFFAEKADRHSALLTARENRSTAGCSCSSIPDNYKFLLTDSLYIQTWLSSIKVAAVSTLLCLLIGYPMALGIARAPPGHAQPAADGGDPAVLDVVPAARLCVDGAAASNNGVLNNMLMAMGLID